MGNWFSFYGRIGRGTFWFRYVVLFVVAVASGLGIVLIARQGPDANASLFAARHLLLVPVVATSVAMYAAAVRRLHDWGVTGWLSLLLMVPFLGLIWLIVLGVREGDPDANEYGPPPLTA